MTDVIYIVVRHEDGWAYKLGDAFSEKFATREEAIAAVRDAAARQEMPGPTETILYEDEHGLWHEETADGDDRPITHLKAE